MDNHTEKTEKNKSKSVANEVSQPQSSKVTFSFKDTRPVAESQRKQQEIASNSSRAKQLMAIQEIMNNDPHGNYTKPFQSKAGNDSSSQTIQKKNNKTGLPDNLKSGVENLSGHSLDDVKVHYNSDKPSQLHAHAYAQGADIHVAPGQEKHLPHETWHVVQQKQGRVKPTTQLNSDVNLNDNAGLEKEADVMGKKALHASPSVGSSGGTVQQTNTLQKKKIGQGGSVLQRVVVPKTETERSTFLQDYSLAAHLVNGVDHTGTETVILDALVANYLTCGFMYTMSSVSAEAFLKGTKNGDCKTLSESFVMVAKDYFNIQGISTGSYLVNFGVPGGGRVLDSNGATGNVDTGSHWAFTMHTWVVGPDRDRDMLFRGATLNRSNWVDSTGEGEEEGVSYREYKNIGEGRVYSYRLMGSLATRYSTKLITAKTGPALDSVAMGPRPGGNTRRCFITTACIKAKGLPDNCEELMILRQFRDNYMTKNKNGSEMIEDYYIIAPQIVNHIAALPDGQKIFCELYDEVVKSVNLVKQGRNKEAMQNYVSVVRGLKNQYL